MQPAWSYSALRDGTMWKLLAAGAAGAVPAAILLPVSWRIAVAAGRTPGEWPTLAALFSLPALLLSLWAAVLWTVAARRVIRLRRLVRAGTRVRAAVREMRLHRSQHSAVGVVVWLEYEVGDRTYRARKSTTLGGVAGHARENGHLDVVVDPAAPHVAALLVDGRLD